MPGSLIIMPTYREAANIVLAVQRARANVPASTILVVDDEGGDGTADLAEQVGRELGGVEVMRRQTKGGLASAYRAGFAWGMERGYEVLIGMDADLSHEAASIPDLLVALVDGADVAVGSRYVPGGSTIDWPLGRHALSRSGNWYAAHLLGTSISDLTSAFRAYRVEALRSVNLDALRAGGYGFLIELAYMLERSGQKIVEVPVQFVNRAGGSSKMSPRIALESLRVVTLMGVSERLKRRGGPR